jgi:hypothetical protein
MKEQFQFHLLIELICPNLYLFIPKESTNWITINKKYTERVAFLELKIKYLVQLEISFHELLFLFFVKKDTQAKDLLILLNKSLLIIDQKLKDLNLRNQFRKGAIRNLLEEPDSNYLNFFGEVLCLALILNTPTYELNHIEFKLPNGKKLDFGIKNKILDSDKGILVEILNIHIGENEEYTELKIKGKIEDKLKAKFSSMEENEIEKWVYGLMPVIWCNINNLKKIQDLIVRNALESERVIDFFSVVRSLYSNGESYFDFGSIKIMKLK